MLCFRVNISFCRRFRCGLSRPPASFTSKSRPNQFCFFLSSLLFSIALAPTTKLFAIFPHFSKQTEFCSNSKDWCMQSHWVEGQCWPKAQSRKWFFIETIGFFGCITCSYIYCCLYILHSRLFTYLSMRYGLFLFESFFIFVDGNWVRIKFSCSRM